MRVQDHPLWPTAIQLQETWKEMDLPDVFEPQTVVGLLYHIDPGIMLDVIFSVGGKWRSGVLFMPNNYLWPYFCFNCWVLGWPRPPNVGTGWQLAESFQEALKEVLDTTEPEEVPLIDPAIAYASVEAHLRQRDDALNALQECHEWLSGFVRDSETETLKSRIQEVLERPIGDFN